MTQIISKKEKELYVHCPYYAKHLKSCPSSKNIIFPEDLKQLETSCLSETFTSCRVYQELIEKAA